MCIMSIMSISDIIDLIGIIDKICILGITFSAWVSVHIPGNVVDEMNNFLVQQWNLLDKSFLFRVSETSRAGSQRHAHHYE